jgi:twitching motility protein PilT
MTRLIDSLLIELKNQHGSDLHLQVGRKPLIRVFGSLTEIDSQPNLSQETINQIAAEITDTDQQEDYQKNKSVDFSYYLPGVARFRVNLYTQMGKVGMVFRQIPETIPTLEELAAPIAMLNFARSPRGLVLVTGPTGSGKSTTLAALIDKINSEREEHILTIEDPIEFVHQPKKALINQREIGRDTPNFARALRDSLREDPDVILVGEMRDNETISIAMTAAETGHLVFGTLHTSSAPSTIDRVIDSFPAGEQAQIRTMLAGSLIGVVSQMLLPKASGDGRVAAHEVLVANNAIRAQIRAQQTAQIRSSIQTGSKQGMQTMDRSLAYLVEQGIINADTARLKAQDTNEFDMYMKNIESGQGITPPEIILPSGVSNLKEKEDY